MKIVPLVVVVLIVLAMAGMFVVGRFVMSSAEVYPSYAYTSAVAVPLSPEVVAYQAALASGELGLPELQELMTSPDETVAQMAALELFGDGEEGAFMFFEELQQVNPLVKELLRGSTYSDWQFLLAWKEVAEPESATRDGAALFLRLPYSRSDLDEPTRSGIGDTLVGTIPTAEGAYADDLAFTIGLYPPSSLDGLKKHLRSGDAQARLVAVQALGRLEDDAALDDVLKRKHDSAVEVREAAYAAEASIVAAASRRAMVYAQATSEELHPADYVPGRQSAKKRLGMP